MKRNEFKGMLWNQISERDRNHLVMIRLDESLPLETEEWVPVEHILMRLTEFAPHEMMMELTTAIASFADDQARRAYILGQEDMACELRCKAA